MALVEYSSEKTAQTAPKPPTGVKAVTDEDSANLSWDSSSGATGYEVDADGKNTVQQEIHIK